MSAKNIVITADDNTPSAFEFNQLAEGDVCTETLRISPQMLEAFAQLSGDYAPVHFDTTHARTMGYDDTITHGFLLTLRFSRLLGMFLPGPNCVIQSVKFDYKRPALTSATLIYTVKLSRLSEAVKLMVLDLSINNDSGEMLVKGTAQCVMLK